MSYKIIQGTNQSLVLDLNNDLSTASKVQILLYNNEKKIKSWDINNITLGEKQATLPFKQNETLYFPYGDAYIEIKWLDTDDLIQIEDIINLTIEKRLDKTILK